MEFIRISMESMDIHGFYGYAWMFQGRLWVDSYIDMEKVLIQNQTLEIGVGQIASSKMTAMTIDRMISGFRWELDLTEYFTV